jgi:TPR repeat protein
MCVHDDVGQRLWVWNPTTYKAFLAMLTGRGNPEACFLSEIKAFFIEHRGYNNLRRAAEGGHDAAAYLYAILLYRDRRCHHR